MLKTETRQIGELTVKVTQFPGRKNFHALALLASFILPALGGVKAKSGKSALDSEFDFEAAVRGVIPNLAPAKLDELVRAMFSSTFINDRNLDDKLFDETFTGENLLLIAPMLKFVVDVNFGDFTKLVGTALSLFDQPESQTQKAPDA